MIERRLFLIGAASLALSACGKDLLGPPEPGAIYPVNPAFPAKNLSELIAQAKARPGEIHFASVFFVADFQVRMLVPLHLAIAVRDLNEPHPCLGKAAGHQAHPAKIRRHGIVHAVELQRGG